MKKLLIVLGIILVLAGILFYVQYMQMSRTVQSVFVPQVQTQETKKESEEIVLDKEKQIGNLVFNYPSNTDIFRNDLKSFNISLNQEIKILDTNTGKSILSKDSPISIILLQNENPKKLTLDKWFDQNNPEKDPQSPFSVVSRKNFTINNMEVIEVVFSVNDNRSGGYYNLKDIYMAYNSDVYIIESYSLPENPDLTLTSGEIKNIQAYEKIVEAIIQSIRFVK